MNPKQLPPPPASGLSLGDIYYIVFRRKWLIMGVALLGFIAAGVTAVVWKPPYQSSATLWIGYSKERSAPDVSPNDAKGGFEYRDISPLASEVAVFGSFDLCKAAAEAVTPARILAKNGGGSNLDDAALVIHRNLTADAPKNTQVVEITYKDIDGNNVQPVLDQIITNYINKHSQIHQHFNQYDEYFVRENEMRKARLEQTEAQLASKRSDFGIVNLDEEMKVYTSQLAGLKQENYMALADLADSEAVAKQLETMIPRSGQARVTNAASTNLTQPPAPIFEAWRKASQHLADLQAYEAKLETTLTTNAIQVKTNLLEIEAAQAQKKELETANPGLLVMTATESPASGAPASLDPVLAYNNVVAKIEGLKARLNVQSNALAVIRDRGTNLNQLEATIRDLERQRQTDEEDLRQIEKSVEQNKIDEELGVAKISNISIVDHPRPPFRDKKQHDKVIAGIAAGGVALGLGLAFLLEMILDRSLRRPKEVVARLQFPLFLNIPYVNGNGHRWFGASKSGPKVQLLSNGPGDAIPNGSGGAVLAPAQNGPVAWRDEMQALAPFYETLRDRLIAHFEMINLTHKPKLVALTSCHNGAGVSTMASGLASLLSETGEGHVLLVNMNSESGDAHRFYKGKLSLGLDDIFEKAQENRDNALLRENLYVVDESSNRDKLPAMLPKRFSHLVTKMKASDYDYIIFDMPPVTQISVTPRLARFMDMVLLVVQAEKTDRDAAVRAAAMLSENKANVGVVMNKSRSYVPRRLHQES